MVRRCQLRMLPEMSMTSLLWFVVRLGGIYVVLGVVLYLFQGRFIFPAGGSIWRTPAEKGWAYESLELAVDGHVTHAWFIPAEGQARGTVLFSHGNGGTMAGRLESVEVFRDLGFDTLIYDYGGYGESTGRASQKRCCEDIRAMWSHLTEEKGVAPRRIVLFGRSLGGGVSADLAPEVEPGAVILESTFTSTVDVAKQSFLFMLFPLRQFARHPFDSAAKVPQINAPLLIVHSRDDDLIPFAQGRKLYDLAGEPKAFLEIRGNHNEGHRVSESVYREGLADFLAPLFQEDGSPRVTAPAPRQ